MNTAYLYENFITRNIRFSNATALKQADINATKIVAEVEGCYVTNTSSYVDVMLASNTVDTLLYRRSYIRFINGNDNTTYLAFIDRIEPNNFNPTETNNIVNKAYRIFITVDWWSTIMWNDTDSDIYDIKHSLEGNVERAHVDDVVREIGTFGYVFRPYLENTKNTAECIIERLETSSKELTLYDGDIKYFLNIISVKKPATTPMFELSDTADGGAVVKKMVGAYSVCSIPIYPYDKYIADDFQPTDLDITINYYHNSAGATSVPNPVVKTIKALPYINDITSSDVVGMYVTPFLRGFDGNRTFNFYYDYVGAGFETAVEPVKFASATVEVEAMQLPPVYQSVPINANDYDVAVKGNIVLYKPNTYEEYLETIVKYKFAPYTSSFFEKSNTKFLLDGIHYDTTILFDIVPSSYGTSALLLLNDNTLSEEARIISIPTADYFNPQRIIDIYSTWGQSVNMARALSNVGSNVASGIMYTGELQGSLAMQGSLGAVNGMVDALTAGAQILKIGKQGLFGMRNDPAPSNFYADPFRITTVKPHNDIKSYILKDLALYGYNTFLHPHEVLTAHERKYFNYIKCNNAQVAVPKYTTEIRLQIEEMFNNGVWLWNTASNFGNFEVPNYPIIMEN